MKSITSFATLSRVQALSIFLAMGLSGCSLVSGSSVPYAQDVQPTVPKPAISEIPAFKPVVRPVEAAPAPAVKAESAPAPQAASQPSTPPPPAPKPPTPQPAPTQPVQSQPAAAPAAAAPEILPPPLPPAEPPADKQSLATPAPTPSLAQAETGSASEKATEVTPAAPVDRAEFADDGKYRNLAQVPSRPVNLPTFAEAAAVEKQLIANRAKSKDAPPPSPETPSPESVEPDKAAVAAPAPPASPAAAIANRLEDRAPCLSQAALPGSPAITVQFDPASSSLTADSREVIADALPTVRGTSGTIRILAHGDTGPDAAQGNGRFDLAAARAGSVAQALAGYGIPVLRIAIGVACRDPASAGASVQLYTES